METHLSLRKFEFDYPVQKGWQNMKIQIIGWFHMTHAFHEEALM